jgi:hypothetical protein
MVLQVLSWPVLPQVQLLAQAGKRYLHSSSEEFISRHHTLFFIRGILASKIHRHSSHTYHAVREASFLAAEIAVLLEQ